MLELKHVTKKYGGLEALKDVSLTIGKGEIVGLFGKNGAGKTTLMKCILGLTECTGEITIDGQAINRENAGKLSFCTCEHSFFPMLTAREHAEFYESYFPNFRKKRFRGMTEFFELPLNRAVGKLSAGQQNQVELILALCQGADYILLDEPFAGLDVFNREDFYKMLLGVITPEETIVLATHLIEETEGFLDRAILIDRGEVVTDVSVSDIEEQGSSLTEFLKQAVGYRSDRAGAAVEEILGEEKTDTANLPL